MRWLGFEISEVRAPTRREAQLMAYHGPPAACPNRTLPLSLLFGLAALACMVLLLSSCATLTRKQCLTIDWGQLGANEAAIGWPLSRLQQHRKACEKADVIPDAAAWTAGHAVGARYYCRPSNAFERGRALATYHGICTAREEEYFIPLYRLGREKGWLEQEVSSERNAISELVSDIESVQRKVSAGTRGKDEVAKDLKELKRRVADKQFDLEAAQRKLSDFNDALLRDGYLKTALRDGDLYRRARKIEERKWAD